MPSGIASFIATILVAHVALAVAVQDACPFDLKDVSGWDMIELQKNLLKEAYGVPKHSFGYRFLTEAPTGFVSEGSDATQILGSVFDPLFYKLNATKPDLPPRRICAHQNWHEKLQATNKFGEPIEEVRGEVPKGPECDLRDCGCYLRYSDACPITGYKTHFVPVPWWWCYYRCKPQQQQ